jgi:hypothetical protein
MYQTLEPRYYDNYSSKFYLPLKAQLAYAFTPTAQYSLKTTLWAKS